MPRLSRIKFPFDYKKVAKMERSIKDKKHHKKAKVKDEDDDLWKVKEDKELETWML